LDNGDGKTAIDIGANPGLNEASYSMRPATVAIALRTPKEWGEFPVAGFGEPGRAARVIGDSSSREKVRGSFRFL